MKLKKDELQKEGWVKRTTFDEPKLSKIIGEYERLGFEVRLAPVNSDEFDEKCRKCYGSKVDKFKTIYVRRHR